MWNVNTELLTKWQTDDCRPNPILAYSYFIIYLTIWFIPNTGERLFVVILYVFLVPTDPEEEEDTLQLEHTSCRRDSSGPS